jgi:hypothetical protein
VGTVSGRDLVDEMRGGAKLPKPPGKGGLVEMLLGAVAVLAVGALAYFGVVSLLGGPHRQDPAPLFATAAVVQPQVAWTSADADRCLARAQAAADAGDSNTAQEGELMPPNPAVTRGYAGLSTLLECHMTVKAARLCGADQKSALVAEVGDYLNRTDLVMAGMAVQGAPMQVMGAVFGGEISAGSGVYDMEHEATVHFMQSYQTKVTTALRKLARDGVLAPSDFAGFMGMGVPETIKRMFGTAVAERHICAT